MKTNLKILLLLAILIAIAIQETSSQHRLKRKTKKTRFLNRFRGLKRLRNYRRYHKGRKRRNANLFGCDCGIAERGADSTKNNLTDFATNEIQKIAQAKRTRIVGGYMPKSRPWMALIELERTPKDARKGNGQCGGAIINKEWIVTAAHCFCAEPLACKLDHIGMKTVVDSELKRVNVYIGVTDVTLRHFSPATKHNASNIIIYPTYVHNKRDQNDIALVHLETPLEFKPNTVHPICLPTGARFKDADISDAYVSGWGLRAQRDCNTIDKGPAKHQRCKFPFVWMNLTHTTCHSASTPSYSNENCKLLTAQETAEGHHHQIDTPETKIVDESGNRITECYTSHPGKAGWCATCVVGAKKGQAGFCRKKLNKPRRLPHGAKPKKHFGRPTASENWGLCSMNCNPIPANMKHHLIQEVQLSTLSNKDCATFGKTMKVVPRIELCAGNKVGSSWSGFG